MNNSISQFYNDYAECWVNYPRLSVRKSYLNLLGNVENKNVLDIGCGCGFDMVELNTLGAYGTGLDISNYSLQIAREKLGANSRWNLMCADFFTYSPNQVFDIVIFSMVIMHYEDMNFVYQKLAQFAKPGGQVLLVTNNPYLVLMDYNLQYPSSGRSVEYLHRFLYKGKEIFQKKYLHAFSDYFSIAKKNGLMIEFFQEQVNYTDETYFFNPTPHNNIPNFITFLYKKAL